MGHWETKAISSTGNETAFLQEIYNYFMGYDETPSELWSGITFSITDSEGTEVGDEPNEMTYTNGVIRNVEFTLDTDIRFIFQSRPANNLSGKLMSAGYNIMLYVGNTLIFSKNKDEKTHDPADTLAFDTSSKQVTAEVERKYVFTKYYSDDVFIFWITPDNATTATFKDASVCFMKFKDTSNNWHWTGYTSTSPIEDNSVYNADGSSPCVKSSMFNFEARTGYLDFISHSSFITSGENGTKAYVSNYIYDCTTVNFGDTLSLKDGALFLAVGDHTMVPLDVTT